MKTKDFDEFEKDLLPNLTDLLKELRKNIGDEYRATDDFGDMTPAMLITISTNDELSHWNYQTGDNSYTGNCYGDPYWGIGILARDTNCKELAKEMIDDLANQIEFEE